MSIEKLLVLSTGHLRAETAKALEADAVDIQDVWETMNGFGFMTAAILSADAVSSGIPTELVNVARFANKLECTVIIFDGDGDDMDEFKLFDW